MTILALALHALATILSIAIIVGSTAFIGGQLRVHRHRIIAALRYQPVPREGRHAARS